MLFIRLLLGLALLGACRPSGSHQVGIELIDDNDFRTVLEAPARRVVSLIPATTELLFALDGDSLLAGRTKWCDYPPEVERIPSVGDGMLPNVESIVGRDPDLVLVYRSPANRDAVNRLRAVGVPVLELAVDRQEDFERHARLVGAAIGRSRQADSLIDWMRKDLEKSKVHSSQPATVLVVAWAQPPIAIGGGSFLSEIIEWAGGTNIFAEERKPSFPVSIEAVALKDPDFVLTVGEGDIKLAVHEEWRAVRAVRDSHFVRVSGSMFSRPSPRIGEAVRQLAAALRTVSR